MSLNIDLIKKVLDYKAKGFEILVSDEGMHIRKGKGSNLMLALAADKIIVYETN